MSTAISFDPSTYNAAAAAPFTLGAVYSYQGKLYRFVKVVTAAAADGSVMCIYDANTTAPTWSVIGANRTTALAGTPVAVIPVGIAVGVISINQFGFVQISGVHNNVLSGTSTLGRWQVPVATNDTAGDGTASLAYTDGILGQCIRATSGGRCSIQLRTLV